jgi:hypothetical protein
MWKASAAIVALTSLFAFLVPGALGTRSGRTLSPIEVGTLFGGDFPYVGQCCGVNPQCQLQADWWTNSCLDPVRDAADECKYRANLYDNLLACVGMSPPSGLYGCNNVGSPTHHTCLMVFECVWEVEYSRCSAGDYTIVYIGKNYQQCVENEYCMGGSPPT